MAEDKNVVEEISLDKQPKKKIKKKSTKLNKTIRFFLGVVLVLAIGYGIFNYVPFIAKYDYYVIATGSMEPVISVRDIVIIDSSTTIDEIEVGEIIAFNVDLNLDGVDEIVVHYFYSVEEIDGELVIKTKPEISDQVDEWDLTEDDILGKHVMTIRKLGGFLLFASSIIGKIVLVFDVLVIYVIIEFLADPKKEKKNEEKNCNETEKTEE